jgi:hypothetical protein
MVESNRQHQSIGWGRTLHLVDIENLSLGDAPICPRQALGWYLARVAWRHGDHTLVAGGPAIITELAFELTRFPCRILVGHGADGADRRLLGAAPARWVTDRFDRLVIASGDHIFTPLAKQVRDTGTPVVAVARPGSMSGTLRQAADQVIEFTDGRYIERDLLCAA